MNLAILWADSSEQHVAAHQNSSEDTVPVAGQVEGSVCCGAVGQRRNTP